MNVSDKINRARECAAHEREMANDPNNCNALDALYDLRLERAAMFDELADLLEAQENSSAKLDDTIAEPVGEIIQYPHANFTIPTVSVELPVGTKLYAHPPTTPTVVTQAQVGDDRAEFDQWFATQNRTSADVKTWALLGWQAHAKLGQTTNKACSEVVPDEMPLFVTAATEREAAEELAYANGWNDCRAAMLKGEK